MFGEVIRRIEIKVQNTEEKLTVGTAIHNQLRGNQDYIDNNIILNIDEPNTILILIFKECKNIPTISI